MYYPDHTISFENIHMINNRAMPEAIIMYKCAIQLHKLYNFIGYSFEWNCLNWNQIFSSRQTTFLTMKTNNTKVGLNALSNKLSILNSLIPLSWLNVKASFWGLFRT